MERNFMKLRQELNDLGYSETLKIDCVPLVDRLFSDLKTTTESLQKYMKIAQQAIEERDNLRLGAEPYKCDNAKLIRECNELHLAFIQFKEQHEKVQKELKSKIVSLQNQLESCEVERQEYQKQIKDLEVHLSKVEKKGIKVTSARSQPSVSKVESSRKTFQLHTAMANADQKIAFLNKELKKLKDEHLSLAEGNELLKNHLQNRDEEIARLKSLLEGGRPLEAINKDCCYKNIDNKIGALRDEICTLKKEKNSLHNQLKDALAKQHEAMRRALHLVERNKELEKEMKDIDHIALAVEAECNSTIRSNAEKVTRLQDRINESVIAIQNLERENNKLKQDKLELSADLDAIKLEKTHLQSLLDTEVEDKKRLTDRINSFTRIENDLNLEIDRLVRLTGEQKRKIAELECQVAEGKLKASSIDVQRPPSDQCGILTKQIDDQNKLIAYLQSELQMFRRENVSAAPQTKVGVKSAAPGVKTGASDKISKTRPGTKEHKTTCKKFSGKKRPLHSKVPAVETSPPLLATYESQIGRCCCEADSCIKHMKELLDKEMEYRQTQAMQQLESLKQEKEYYMKEYHRVCDQIRNVPTHDGPDTLQEQCEQLKKEISEKNKTIADLQNEIETLGRDKYTLKARVESLKQESEIDINAVCERPLCKRQRRELDILRTELKHLESENDSLKSRIQTMNECVGMDQERMKKAFLEMEEHIRKLEDERREMVIGQATARSSQTQLEEDCNLLQNQLRATQTELNNQKANYNQLKTLHDQCDRNLSEAYNKVMRLESEMATMRSKMSNSHRESESHEKEIGRLQSDIDYMKVQLTKIDKEKDDLLNLLDEKTEKMASLEDQLREKKGTISSLEIELKELKRKLGNFTDEASMQQQSVRSLKQEFAILERDYDNERKQKEAALQENKRLHNDLSSVINDLKDTRKQLELSLRQVDDLKRQLQHYVAEVKRTEDLISQKELERTEILDQFKSLSQEANVLESNNHTLENEATQSRVQLSVALDHASDLERKLENQDSVIRSYEKQISELTSQVASLEIQLKQSNSQYERIMTELTQTKDLCLKLDRERENLKKELHEDGDQREHAERNIEFHIRQTEELKRLLEKEKNNLEGVEKLLKDARQDVIAQRLLNQDLQGEITKLKSKVDELQERLVTTSEQLDLYQEKALDYSQQNKQLRRDIANERFFRAKEDETKRYPSL